MLRIELSIKIITPPLLALFLLIGSFYILNNPYKEPDTWETSIKSNTDVFLDRKFSNIEYSPSSSLTLNGNKEFNQIATEEEWPGEGTLANPYRISALNISGGELEKPLIDIRNTDVSFSIEYCLLQNGEISVLFINVKNGVIANNLLNNNDKGIILKNSKSNLIENNSITNTKETTILIENSRDIRITKNRIENTTQYGGYGVFLLESESCIISSNLITNINADTSLWLDFGSNFNTISNNSIYNTTNGNGISIGSKDGGAYKNTILNNSIYYNEKIGISLFNSNDNVILENSIFQNGEDGVYLESTCYRNEISNNTIAENSNSGIFIDSSVKNVLQNNLITNNSQYGVWVTESNNTMLFRNEISQNDQKGIYLTSTADLSLVMLNGFVMNNGVLQAHDDGVNNYFTQNYWNDRIGDFYTIEGQAGNRDVNPSIQIEKIKEPVHLEPNIIYPNGLELLAGVVTIRWETSVIVENYPYSIYYSPDGGLSWKLISSDVTGTSFIWETPSSEIGLVYLIKIVTLDYLGSAETDISMLPFLILNMSQLIIGLLILISLLTFSIFILQKKGKFGIGRIEQKPKLIHQKSLISMCLGSYTDKGLRIQRKTESCRFKEQDLQSMADYSSVLYQHGETERIYGPFPKKIEEDTEIIKWHFISFNFSIKDSSVIDSRIMAQKSMVPVLLLLIYPQEYDHVISRWKEEIRNFLKTSTKDIPEIANLTDEWLLRVEEEVRKLIAV
ncbi:MAG: right-handed parallel beta-helix repeat-containing protein [Candidatus Hodarchaeales archaeon]